MLSNLVYNEYLRNGAIAVELLTCIDLMAEKLMNTTAALDEIFSMFDSDDPLAEESFCVYKLIAVLFERKNKQVGVNNTYISLSRIHFVEKISG